MTSDFRFNHNAVPFHGFCCYRFETLGSTQDLLKEWVSQGLAKPGTVVLAEGQTSGRGRPGHIWESLQGKGLWMSVYFQPCIPVEWAFGWNMRLALAVCKVLDALVPSVPWQIKWPNDWVTYQGRKVGGMLVENQLKGSCITDSLVGIGINVDEDAVNSSLPYATSLRGEWKRSTLAEQEPNDFRKEGLLQALLAEFEFMMNPGGDSSKGFNFAVNNPITGGWNIEKIIGDVESRLYGLGQRLPFQCGDRTEYWITLGLDQGGGLRVRSESGELQQTLIHPHYRLAYTLNLS